MRALLSVYDKTGIADLARGLSALGWDVVSTGGTLAEIAAAGVAVTSVAELTGSPEMLGGRVKTLHPRVHGGLLYRRGHPGDEAEVAEHGIPAIDLVAGNLYPFVETVTGGSASLPEALEQIDIGGPTMIRAAAKNHPAVVPLVDPADYGPVLEALRGSAGEPSGLDADARRRLAAKAFAHVAHYDTMVAEYLRGEGGEGGEGGADGESDESGQDGLLPAQLTLGMTRRQLLRYGENPHQRGAFYTLDSVRSPVEGAGALTQHHGQGLSYVNILDVDAAFNLVTNFDQPAVAIIKHTNPCCLATGDGDLAALYEHALNGGDAISAYGGIVASNRPIDMPYARALREVLSPENGARMLFDVVIAPDAEPEALEHLKKKSRNLRILTAPVGDPKRARLDFRPVRGGVVVQDADLSEETEFTVVSERQPSEAELRDLRVAWVACKHVKSNAVTMVKDGVLVGMGAGQPNRVESARLAAKAAGERARGAAAATDAFIPFPDTVEVCVEAGATAVLHTGGSIRDEDSIAAANRLGVSLLTSGVRHFRH